MRREIDVIIGRELRREEIDQIWTIDRSEVIDRVYRFRNGEPTLEPEHYDMTGWPTGAAEKRTPILVDCLYRGGWMYGLFDQEKLIGFSVLESKFIGRAKDQLQLKSLHVSRPYRKHGLGRRLFESTMIEARARGAKRLYISAMYSENTINFYLRLGCVVTREIDANLFALEPEDIHLECDV
jgi:predicted N-acetyltransferase YhbS